MVVINRKLIKEFQVQSKTHPDKSIRAYYEALQKIAKESKNFNKFLSNVIKKRLDLNEKHLANLIYRSTQYIMLYHNGKRNLSDMESDDWVKEYTALLSDGALQELHYTQTISENTQTTKYQRYAGPKAALRAIFDSKSINVADLGCGLNIGLPGIELDFPYLKIKDNTGDNKITQLIKDQVFVKQGISVDIYDPKEKLAWALACSFYPGELGSLEETESLIDFLWNKTRTSFYRYDAKNIARLWNEKKLPLMDAVITSTFLYQLNDEERKKTFRNIGKILKQNGILIVNDFVEVDGSLSWDVDWFEKGASSYRTVILVKNKKGFSRPYEFIVWKNARCREASAGRDFEKVINFKF
ncbi:hypothetical protein C4561_05525 [candidate division WWE3 bacterium]|jgi:hypothetical protein|uniref:Uncharacterized protein n=1 Tax=candidate division WWE3 bacterium TaxID=2053526 RepID=A0A3A4ZI28_UNCKA|nr:MAG: hypothetical protein C4561_05525 [candidate division WWE3 bacterium]